MPPPAVPASARMKTVHIVDYRGAAEALSSQDVVQALYDESALYMQGVLLTLDGAAHAARRQIELGMLNSRQFREYERERFITICRQQPELRDREPRAEVDLVDLSQRIVVRVAADLAGIDISDKVFAGVPRLIRLTNTFRDEATSIHSLRDRGVLQAEAVEALQEFERLFVRPSIERRLGLLQQVSEGAMERKALPQDVLTVLLANRESLGLEDRGLLHEMAFHMVSGLGATLNAAVNSMHRIFMWQREHAEDRRVRAREPVFLRRCIEESLRLSPTSPVAWRRVLRPLRVERAGWLEEGDYLIIDVERANRDPAVFGPDADSFNPDRSIAAGALAYGLSLGHGVHGCPAQDLLLADARPGARGGILPRLIGEYLLRGMTPHPEHEPRLDDQTERSFWKTYPVVLGAA